MDEHNLIDAMEELGILGGCQADMPSLVAAARKYLAAKHGIETDDLAMIAAQLEKDCRLELHMKGERVMRLNLALRKWALLPLTVYRSFAPETAEGIRTFEKCTHRPVRDELPDLETLSAIRAHSRTILDYLDAEAIARITNGRWVGDVPKMLFDRVTFGPSRLPGNELLIAPSKGSAEGAHLGNPWPHRAVMTNKAEPYSADNPLLVVPSVVRSTALLAQYARTYHRGKFIAITGSSGKTSTKEMLAQALACQMLTCKTGGTSNSLYATANVIINGPLASAASVFECGLGMAGSMLRDISATIRPHIALVTSVAAAHLGGYSSVAEIAAKKLEIANHLEPDGELLIDGDSEILQQALDASPALKDKKVVRFGFAETCAARVLECNVTERGTRIRADIFGEQREFMVPLFGAHWAKMAAATLAVTKLVGGDLDESIRALAVVKFAHKGRGELIRLETSQGAIHIFDSHYNANPGSMQADLASYAALQADLAKNTGQRIGVIGAFGEIGDGNVPGTHQDLARVLVDTGFDSMYLIGDAEFDHAKAFLDESRVRYRIFPKIEDCLPLLAEEVKQGDFLFVKGSHKWNLAAVTPYLQEHFTKS